MWSSYPLLASGSYWIFNQINKTTSIIRQAFSMSCDIWRKSLLFYTLTFVVKLWFFESCNPGQFSGMQFFSILFIYLFMNLWLSTIALVKRCHVTVYTWRHVTCNAGSRDTSCSALMWCDQTQRLRRDYWEWKFYLKSNLRVNCLILDYVHFGHNVGIGVTMFDLRHNEVRPIWMKLLSCHALAATVCIVVCFNMSEFIS